MTRYKACVSGRLTCALELLRRSELAYNDRGGLRSNPRNRLQKRALTRELRILLDAFFNFFLQVFNLALDLVKEVLVGLLNCFVLCLIQPILSASLFFLEGLASPSKLLKAALRR